MKPKLDAERTEANIQNGKVRIVCKLLIVFLLPVAIACWLYPLGERVVFNGKDYQRAEFKIEDLFLFREEPTFRNFIADVFSLPLHLDWYKVSIVYDGIDPGCPMSEQSLTIFLTFSDGDPRVYQTDLKETTAETGGYQSGPGHPTYYLRNGEKAFFIAPSWINYSIDGGFVFGTCEQPIFVTNELELPDTQFFYDFTVTIKPHWAFWFTQLLIIFIFWIFLLSSLISIFDWLKKRQVSF